MRVLLGCELAGNGNAPRAPRGYWVVTDASRLMVRYVFLLKPSATAPPTEDIAPKMLSVFKSLRSAANNVLVPAAAMYSYLPYTKLGANIGSRMV
jgi:hypothetical protein